MRNPNPIPNDKLGGAGFHHIAIRVPDFEGTRKFYREGLGFSEKIAWGEGDGRACMLDTGDGNYLEIFAGGKREPKPEGALLHIAIRTSDTEAAHARALEFGATEQMPPKQVTIDTTNGAGQVPVKISFVVAPDGAVIEFFENDGTW